MNKTPEITQTEQIIYDSFNKYSVEKEGPIQTVNLMYWSPCANEILTKLTPVLNEAKDLEIAKLKACIKVLNHCLTEAPVDFLGTGTSWKAADNEYKEWYNNWQTAIKSVDLDVKG